VRAEILAAIRRSDALRGPPLLGESGAHKEWYHFCISAGGVELLVNLSLVADVRAGAAGQRHARLSLLAFDGERWHGGVERCAEETVSARVGRIGMAMGESEMRFSGGCYHLSIHPERIPISAELTLRPLVLPAQVNNVRGLDGAPINWAAVPRLTCDGWLELDGRRAELHGALAYHDHNWGSFGWGRNFAWEWGYVLPEEVDNPWTAVFARLNSRGHTRALMQLLFLWRGPRLVRAFRAQDLTVRRHGTLRVGKMFKVPRPMALLSPGTAAGIPERLEVTAKAHGDEATLTFASGPTAQVIIPNDHDDGVTIINEVAGRAELSAELRGERVRLSGPAIFEFLSA
jgi:hypothetical protein